MLIRISGGRATQEDLAFFPNTKNALLLSLFQYYFD